MRVRKMKKGKEGERRGEQGRERGQEREREEEEEEEEDDDDQAHGNSARIPGKRRGLTTVLISQVPFIFSGRSQTRTMHDFPKP